MYESAIRKIADSDSLFNSNDVEIIAFCD